MAVSWQLQRLKRTLTITLRIAYLLSYSGSNVFPNANQVAQYTWTGNRSVGEIVTGSSQRSQFWFRFPAQSIAIILFFLYLLWNGTSSPIRWRLWLLQVTPFTGGFTSRWPETCIVELYGLRSLLPRYRGVSVYYIPSECKSSHIILLHIASQLP